MSKPIKGIEARQQNVEEIKTPLKEVKKAKKTNEKNVKEMNKTGQDLNIEIEAI